MKIREFKGFHKPLIASVAMLALLSVPSASFAQDQGATPSTSSPDNSKRNAAPQKTAEQQKENTSDRMTTKKIRQSIMADKSLSMYAHNVKIITENGSVTLKGPVKSDDEKQAIGSKAAEVVGGPDKVMNQLTVKQ